jgi:hypothetical protein
VKPIVTGGVVEGVVRLLLRGNNEWRGRKEGRGQKTEKEIFPVWPVPHDPE